jgi:GDPmannose 4,6-dehydratase
MKIIITGISGQTGSYLSDALLSRGDEVHGIIRRSSTFGSSRLKDTFNHPNLHLYYGDLQDYGSIANLVSDIKPDMFFNLGAQSHVKVSFDIPEYTFDVNATGPMRCLEVLRKFSPKTKFLQASTSELFGSLKPEQQNLDHPFKPRSPYGAAKAAAFYATVNYREAYNMFCVNSVSYNHESPRRLETFITRKITRGATRIKLGLQKELVLGNMSAKRDWIHAKDVVRGMLMIMDAEQADDFIMASGVAHSVEDFVKIVFGKLDLDWKEYVKTDPKYFRPSEVDHLQGDYSKIKKALGWEPQISFESLINEMIEADLCIAKKEIK